MAIRIAINGFGRIGRLFFRALKGADDIEVVAINALADAAPQALLLQYDAVHGRYEGEVAALTEGDSEFLVINGQKIPCLGEKVPANLPWADLGVEVVVEATGIFRTREGMQGHIEAGAKKVLLTAPPKGEIDAVIVFGVNEDSLKASDVFVSNASCTTNCLGPMAKVLNDEFGIIKGLMPTIHAYTGDQNLQDGPHKDLRRARAAAVNIVPTSTGAAKAIGLVMPELKGKLDGYALRVPIPTGSVTDLTVELAKPGTAAEINAVMKAEAVAALNAIVAAGETLLSVTVQPEPLRATATRAYEV